MRPLTLSMLIHALLLITLSTEDSGDEGGKAKEKQSSVKIMIVDKPVAKEIKTDQKSDLAVVNKSKVMVKKKKAQKKQVYIDHKCEHWYSGIGVMQGNDGSCVITFVGKGYPADRAGIVPGDLMIQDETGCPGRGPLGGELKVKILRGRQLLIINLIREKICEKDM